MKEIMKKYLLHLITATVILFANSITIYAQAPVYVSSLINNATPTRLEITYNVSLANIIPAASSFNVLVNSGSMNVTTVAISGTKVLLFITNPVVYGDVISVSYTRPGFNAIQAITGELAASLTPQNVTNNVISVTPVYNDNDGNSYDALGIGFQIWMKENLKTTKYNDGTSIPNVVSQTTWAALTTPAYCWYNNDIVTYKDTYGALYNGFTINTGKICPVGWHVPSHDEWTTSENFLLSNGFNYDGTTSGNKYGKALASTTLWNSSTTTGAVGNTDYPSKRNATGFTALPSGYRATNAFNGIGTYLFLWSSAHYTYDPTYHETRDMDWNDISFGWSGEYEQNGCSVRCLQNVQPIAEISGTTAVCMGAGSPNITFTGITGTAPFTFTYNLNGGGNQAITTTSGNSVTVSVPTGTAGTYTYSLISVQDAYSTVAQTVSATVTIRPTNTINLTSASSTTSQTVCINTAITPITYTTTGATGAIVTNLPTGISGVWSGNVVTISGTPSVAGAARTYTVTLTGGCGNITNTGTIAVTANNTISLSSAAGTNAQITCINTAITPITYTTTGATGASVSNLPTGVSGVWSGNVVTISGTPTVAGAARTYTVTLTGGCGVVTSTGTMTVTANNTVNRTSSVGTDVQTVCINTAITSITYATTGVTGATVTGLPAGVTGLWAANVVTISGTPTASVPFTYTITLTGGCGVITTTGTIAVTANNTVNRTSPVGTDAQTVCINTAITNITY